MALLPNLKRLLIPRKGSNKVTDLDTNWRAIERWAGALNEGGFYASLTGAGETTTPGELTQQGDFSVLNGVVDFEGNGVVSRLRNTGNIEIDSFSGNASLGAGGVAGVAGIVRTFVGQNAITYPSTELSFFQGGPGPGFAQQTITGSRGGNAALANLLTALANYGLIVDTTT